MTAVFVPALMPAPSTATTRDEREPDHQRGGGRRGPARVADRVGAGQLAGDAAGAARRPAHHAGERLDEARREQRDAREQPEHADAEQQRRRAPALTPLANMPADDRRQRRERARRARSWSECAANFDGGQHGTLADRRDRRHAGRPPRRQDAREQRDAGADEQRDDDRVRARRPCRPSGSSTPSAANRATMPLAIPSRATSPITEATRPMTRPSSRTERMTCLREAPSVRSVANSRVRWATVIDRVLKITNAPTSSAMAPKPSSTLADHRHARR